MRVKQRIARLLIHEIIANTDDDTREIVLVIHWAGGRRASRGEDLWLVAAQDHSR